MADEREDMDDPMAAWRVDAAGSADDIGLPRRELRLPVDDRGEVPGGVIVVAVGLFAKDAAEVGGQRDLPVRRLGIRAILCRGRGDDLRLLLGRLIAEGLGIAAVAREICDCEHRP